MGVLTQVSILDAFLIFFFTLGPLKALDPFAQATQGAYSAFRRTVAWRATAIATAIVIAVALLGSVVLKQWRVSLAAVVMSGSIIIFCQSWQMIMKPPDPAPPPLQPQGTEPTPLSSGLACFPIAVPALVTAPGIAAILVFMAIAGGDWRQTKFGTWLGMALEFQLGADIVATTVNPTLQSLIELALLAAVRTFLNFFLQKELEAVERLAPRMLESMATAEIRGPDNPENA